MHVASICFQVFLGVPHVCLEVFHLDVAYVYNGFQMILRRFRKYFRCLLQVFHLFFLYVAMLHLVFQK
jgi:hypothetical protein